MSGQEWVRLKGANNWGSTYFALNPLSEMGIARPDRALRLVEGEKVQVRLADGSVHEGHIHMRNEEREINDMGNSYKMTDDSPCVQIPLHGHMLEVEFDEIDVPKAWVTERTPKDGGET